MTQTQTPQFSPEQIAFLRDAFTRNAGYSGSDERGFLQDLGLDKPPHPQNDKEYVVSFRVVVDDGSAYNDERGEPVDAVINIADEVRNALSEYCMLDAGVGVSCVDIKVQEKRTA